MQLALNPIAVKLAQRAALYPGQTQRQAPFIAVSGQVPEHKDLKEPPFLSLLVLRAGASYLWQSLGYEAYPADGDTITINLHEWHGINVGKGQVFIALYGAGQTSEEAEANLTKQIYNHS